MEIFIEDNHAGSFFYWGSSLPALQPYTLLLFDLHSDATAAYPPGRLWSRWVEQVKRDGEWATESGWRRHGVIQSFNWIEPLMAGPVEKVVWIAGMRLSNEQLAARKRDASLCLSSYSALGTGSSTNLRRRYAVTDFFRLKTMTLDENPLLVSVDMDLFSSESREDAVADFQKVMLWVASQRRLTSLTFALSFPFFATTEFADTMATEALKCCDRFPMASVVLNVDPPRIPELSDHAQRLRSEGRPVSAFEFSKVSSSFRHAFENLGRRARRWPESLNWPETDPRTSHDECSNGDLVVTDGSGDLPGCGPIVLHDHPFTIHPRDGAARVRRWWIQRPASLSYDLSGTANTWAAGAPRILYLDQAELPNGSGKQAIDEKALSFAFDGGAGCGTIRVGCDLEKGGDAWSTEPLTLSIARDYSYPGHLTELFGLPYVFGSEYVSSDGEKGPMARLGADCANFLIYGFRRRGNAIPWGDARHLRSKLREIDVWVRTRDGAIMGRHGKISVTPQEIESGLILMFDAHAAALYEDRPPLGVLDWHDLVVHQLGGKAEIVELGALAAGRDQFSVMVEQSP